MTIAQALKEKNKIVERIGKMRQRFSMYNSAEEGSEREYDPKESFESLQKEIDAIIDIKTKIHTASAPVRSLIFKQSELKSHVKFLKGVSTQSGTIRNRYSSEEPIKYNAVVGRVEMDKLIESLETEIEQIQEKLDSFNHSTTI